MADEPIPRSPQYPRGPGYDEQGALQRLEQLRRDIQTARRRREQAAAEFDDFVASFREAPGPRPVVPPTDARSETRALVPGRDESIQPVAPAPVVASLSPQVTPPPTPPQVAPTSSAEPASGADANSAAPPLDASSSAAPADTNEAPAAPGFQALPPLSLPAAKNTRTTGSSALWRVALAGGLLAATVAGFLIFRSGSEDLPEAPAASAGTPVATAPVGAPRRPSGGTTGLAAAPTASPAPAVPAAQQPAAAVPPGVLRLELVARNPVWIRVTVDGRRIIEREVPAGFRRTIDAERAVAIRAGNAGALMVAENGAAPSPLGREGQVVTRIFPSPSER